MKKEKLEIIYSIGIIIAIPLLIVANTVYLVRSTRSAYNNEFRKKADLVNSVIAESVRDNIANKKYPVINEQLNSIQKQHNEVSQAMIVQLQNNTLAIVAGASDAPKELTPSASIQHEIVYKRKTPVATFINVSKDGNHTQGWKVATPVFDAKNNVIAVTSSTVLTTDAEEAINKAFSKSFIIMIISIVAIIILLFRHFRLVGYIQLLAKQREINQTMSDFLSVATHELKAPTSIIKGYVANVMDETFGPITPEVKEQLQVALSQTDRLNHLVQDLLNVSRIEQGRIEYHIEPVDSSGIIDVIAHNYRPIAEQKSLVLNYDKPTEPLYVKADAGRVQEIFTNLIDNAIKYTPSGSVTITQKLDGPTVKTSIRDTGVGMSVEHRKRLFQRFYRIQTEQTKNISGTGLGLWIIKQYIEAMGGKIDIDSMEGVGTEFTVTLPIM